MNKAKVKRGVLLKMGICRDTLISQFISGLSLSEIGSRYNRTGERIWQIIRRGCDENEYKQFIEQKKKNREAAKLAGFMAYTKELGRVPCLNEALKIYPGIQTYYHKFRKVAEESGFVHTTKHYKRGRRRLYTEVELLSHLKKLASKLGYTPSCNEINKKGKFTHNMYVTCFGSMQKAQELAGLSPNKKYNSLENARRHPKYITKEHCLEDLKRLHIELGGPPSLVQLKKHGKYTFSKYYNRLGGIKKMRELPELKELSITGAF